jgi:hypothetical protein
MLAGLYKQRLSQEREGKKYKLREGKYGCCTFYT